MHSAIDKLVFNGLTLPFRPFYRRYPFTSPVSIRSADDRGCVDMEMGFFCNRIPKAANSTIITNLARLKFGQDISSKQAKKLFDTPARLSAADVEQFDSLFRFTVVRNPYSRILSAYLDKIERRARKNNRESSFRDFLQALKSSRFMHGNAHWAPQHSLMLIPIDSFDLIGKVESLDRDLAEVKRRLRPDIEDNNTSFDANATGANSKLKNYYDSELIALVRNLYSRDFEAFGYSPEFPA